MSVLHLFLHGNTIFPLQYAMVRIRPCTQDLRHKFLPLELGKSLLQVQGRSRQGQWLGRDMGGSCGPIATLPKAWVGHMPPKSPLSHYGFIYYIGLCSIYLNWVDRIYLVGILFL